MTEDEKIDAVVDALSELDYRTDDLAKLFCRMFKQQVVATGANKSSIRKVIYGEGYKFIFRVNMLLQEAHENPDEEY